MEVVVGRHVVQGQGAGRKSGGVGALPECEVNTPMMPDHATFEVHSSRLGRVRIGRFSWVGLNTLRPTQENLKALMG